MEYIPEIITALISIIISFLVGKINLQYEIKKQKNSEIYLIKKETLFLALSFVDTYISWLTIDGKKPIRDTDESIKSLTMRGRECYNKLCVTCDNQQTIDAFNNILFDENGNIFESYNKFRNEVRKELGLKTIQFSNDKIFYSVVSTDDLNKNE